MGLPVALKHQLALALVAPATAVVALTATFADIAAQRALEHALGDRLSSIAGAAVELTDPNELLLERGEDDFRSRRNALTKLRGLRDSTGVEQVLIVRLADDGAVVDTSEALKVGEEYLRAQFDRAELERVKLGYSIASVLFNGPDGRRYKTGYAPLRDGAGRVAGFAAVNGHARFFEAIDALRRTMGVILLFGCTALLVAAIIIARGVSIPLQRLSSAAERIGRGELDAEVPSGGTREAVVLASTMTAMAGALAERDKEMRMMIAGIAHEVRNPLGGIELFSGLLLEDLPEGDPRRRHVEKISREVKTLSRVVNEFLELARKTGPTRAPTSMAELIDEVVSLSRQDASLAGVELSSVVDASLVVFIDRDAIQRTILNLIRNAIQATPIGGRVHTRVEQSERGLSIVVSDTGPGIPEDQREAIFAPFFTTKQKGTGLGLALAKKAVEAHGGTLSVRDREGGGAELCIELPSKTPS